MLIAMTSNITIINLYMDQHYIIAMIINLYLGAAPLLEPRAGRRRRLIIVIVTVIIIVVRIIIVIIVIIIKVIIIVIITPGAAGSAGGASPRALFPASRDMNVCVYVCIYI